MDENIVFSKQDFYDLGIDKDLIDEVFKEIPIQGTKIQQIKQIGINLENLIKQYIDFKTIDIKKTNTRRYSFQSLNNKNDRLYVDQILKMSTAFIFELRYFLLADEIIFSIGGLYKDESQTTFLAEKRLNQREMLKNIRASLSSKAMVLSGSLENFKSDDVRKESNIVKMWNQVLEMTDTSDFKYNSSSPYKIFNTNNKNRRFYQNPNADKSVWLRYVTKAHNQLNYYLLSDGMSFFNNGWLYEWFQSYTVTQEHIDNLANSLNKGSVKPIISRMDSVAGYKGGDYKAANGRSIQAKYGNDQIISFTSILQVIFDINTILSNYESENSSNLENMAQQLFDLFTDESTLSSLSLGVNKTKEHLLAILQNK